MAAKPLPDQATLLKLLRYDPETGKLFWRERGIEWFRADATHSAERRWRAWNSRLAGKEAFSTLSEAGYWYGHVLNKKFLAHRIVWQMQYGCCPEQIDHINGDRADNRLQNLRAATQAINSKNVGLKGNNSTGYLGITFRGLGKCYRAVIKGEGKTRHLGYFRNLEDAVKARRAAERELGYHPNHGKRRGVRRN